MILSGVNRANLHQRCWDTVPVQIANKKGEYAIFHSPTVLQIEGNVQLSTNENNEVPTYFDTGKYETIAPSKNCLSSAMNVGHPSNMARLIQLYGGVMTEKGVITDEPDINQIKKDMYAVSISDDETKEMIIKAFNEVWHTSMHEERSLRNAAYTLALRRIGDAVTAHGTREYFKNGQ